MYRVKQSGAHVVELLIGDGTSKFPLFEYEDEALFLNPGIPATARVQDKPGSVLVRTSKTPRQPITQIPEATMKMLQNIRNKG